MSLQSREITFGGKSVFRNGGNYPHPIARLANQFVHPLGGAYGVGYLLMRQKDVQALTGDTAEGGPHRLHFRTEGFDANDVYINGLYIERAVRLAGGSRVDDPNAIYGVRVVDRRFFLNRFSESVADGEFAFNLRTWASKESFVEETLVDEIVGEHSVESVITTLWGRLPEIAGAAPTFPDEFDDFEHPENLYVVGNTWHAINDLLLRYGYALRLNPDAGTFDLVKLRDLDQDFDLKLDERFYTYDAGAFNSGAVSGPRTIRVCFPIRYEDYGTERDHPFDDNFITTRAFHTIDKSTGLIGTLADTFVTLWDPTPALILHGEDGVLGAAELAKLDAIATKRKDAWVAAHNLEAFARTHLVYPGLIQQFGAANVRRVVWRDFGGRPGQGGLSTELIEGSTIDRDCDPGRGAGILDDEERDENFLPIDFARPGPPTYPRTADMVRIVQDASPPAAGEPVNPAKPSATGAGTLFSGWTVFPDLTSPDILVNREQCWVLISESFAEAVQDEVHFGRLLGVYELAGDRRPLYVVGGPYAGGGVRIAETDSAGIAAGGSASVGELNDDGTAYEEDGAQVFYSATNVFTSAIGGNRRILTMRWRRDPSVEVVVAEDCPVTP